MGKRGIKLKLRFIEKIIEEHNRYGATLIVHNCTIFKNNYYCLILKINSERQRQIQANNLQSRTHNGLTKILNSKLTHKKKIYIKTTSNTLSTR